MEFPVKILYVEDNADDADLVIRYLQRNATDFEVDWAKNLTAARARLAVTRYQLVLIDLRLPDGSGLDLLAEIREWGVEAATVILTGLGDEEIAVTALKAGVDDYIVKHRDYLENLPLILEAALARFHSETRRRAGLIKVLYVEHHSIDVDLTRRHLARYAPQIRLTVAPSAEQALKQLLPGLPGTSLPYHVLLLDYQLPGLNALELLKTLKTERQLDIPIVLITGQGNEEVAVQALRLGAANYLVKNAGYLYKLPIILENTHYRAQLESEQAALRESEARFRRLAENARDIIYRYEFTPRRGFTYVSPAATGITGYTPEDHYADPDLGIKLVHPDDRHLLDPLFAGVNVNTRPLVLRWIHRNGQVIWTEQHNVPIFDETGQLVALEGIARDISARVELEERLHHSQRLESVGQLAGGIAHDLNNVLVPIIGYAELGRDELGSISRMHSYFSQIQQAGEHAAQLTRQILAFSRRQVLQIETVNLNEVIANVNKIMRRLLGEEIEVHTSLNPNLHLIKADITQLEQVLLNLVVNARDAMPDGGQLTLETDNVELDNLYYDRHPEFEPGNYVVMTISDTGYGMESAIVEHIFEPYFTTKERHKGTGLGLATVFGIVKQHRGNIFVYSEPGHGATFKVYLPRAESDAIAVPVAEPPPVTAVSGRESVLLVEDDDRVRLLVQETLQAYGYRVLEAKLPLAGLELVIASPEQPIQLLLTDVVLPQMNGKQLFERLARYHPAVRVIYMSGYSDEVIVRQGLLQEGANFLQKPFSVKRLVEKIRTVLDQ